MEQHKLIIIIAIWNIESIDVSKILHELHSLWATFTFEPFRPFDEFSDGQSLLFAREAEGEAEWKDLFVDPARLGELRQALSNVVEQLVPVTGHQLLADGKHLRVHVESRVKERIRKDTKQEKRILAF